VSFSPGDERNPIRLDLLADVLTKAVEADNDESTDQSTERNQA